MIDTWSEEWRQQCEARSVLRRPFEERAAWLAKVEESRGKAGRETLERAIRAEWDRQRQASRAATSSARDPSGAG